MIISPSGKTELKVCRWQVTLLFVTQESCKSEAEAKASIRQISTQVFCSKTIYDAESEL
jgi:hypothetical protein